MGEGTRGLLRESHPALCARHVGACPLITCASSRRRTELTDAAANEASDAHQQRRRSAGVGWGSVRAHATGVLARVLFQNKFACLNSLVFKYVNLAKVF